MSAQTTNITTNPGVKRDGTQLDGQFYSDAVWCRFYAGKPRKIGGYRKMAQFALGIVGVHVFSRRLESVVHVGSQSKLQGLLVDNNGNGSAVYDRTPLSFIAQTDYKWTFDTAFDATGSGQAAIYAHAGRNLQYIDNNIITPVFYGAIGGTTTLTTIVLTDTITPSSTGSITNGLVTLTLALATGFAVGNFIEILGAGVGGVDLYATIIALAGVTATIDTAAGTTVASAIVNHIVGSDGGVLTIGPYLFTYGSNGLIANSDTNQPKKAASGDSNQVNVTGSKVVHGLPMRGGGHAPAGIFWAVDSVITASFVGGALVYQYDIASSQSSILSSDSIIEYDGVFYWIGSDRFLMYAGGVKEVPNVMNNLWFFDNLNWQYRQKVFAAKVPKYGEIWWHFPMGTSTVCNWAIVFNVRDGTWYDTPSTRSAGYYVQTFPFPVWGDETGALWQQEFGWDKVADSSVTAISSSFTTHDIGLPLGGAVAESPQGRNAWTRIERIEPDFNQVGPMTVTVITREYAKSPIIDQGALTFNPTDVRVDLRRQGRLLNIRFTSNAQGGFYHMGVVLMHLDMGDTRE